MYVCNNSALYEQILMKLVIVEISFQPENLLMLCISECSLVVQVHFHVLLIYFSVQSKQL